MHQARAAAPKRVIPRTVTGLLRPSLHRDHEGEWDFDLAWKPIESWPAYAGWLAAVRRGQPSCTRGLDLPFPALVLSSAPSRPRPRWATTSTTTDIVLDVRADPALVVIAWADT